MQIYILKEIESSPWRKEKESLAGSGIKCHFEEVEQETASRSHGKLSETLRFEVKWVLRRVETRPDSEERESREIRGIEDPRRLAGGHILFR